MKRAYPETSEETFKAIEAEAVRLMLMQVMSVESSAYKFVESLAFSFAFVLSEAGSPDDCISIYERLLAKCRQCYADR